MHVVNQLLQERPQSGFPLSIGTSLALETVFEPTQDVFDQTRQIPDKPDPSIYSDYLVNVSTLLRNIVTSIPYQDIRKCSKLDVYSVLMEEVDYMRTLFSMEDKHLHFYTHTYAYPNQTYPDKLRKATTEQQLFLFSLIEYCVKRFNKEESPITFSKDVSLSPTSSTLILTHVPWDLLSHGRFRRLDLLESHTGVIKTRKSWNTKYFKLKDKDMSFLPFMEYLLTTFGCNTMFKPSAMQERINLYENLLKKKVHPLMSEVSMLLQK